MAFIKIDRNILKWEWYKDISTKCLFIHLLLLANWKDGTFHGSQVPRGSFITSIRHLSDESNLSPNTIKKSLKKLEKTGEIKTSVTHRYTQIFIVNYEKYQSIDSENESKYDTKYDTKYDHNRRSKEVKNIRSKEKRVWGSFSHVMLEESELESLKNQFGEDLTLAKIEYLDQYIEERGYRSNNHFVTLQKWMTEDAQKKSIGLHGSNKVQKLKTPSYYGKPLPNQDKASPEQLAEIDALLQRRKKGHEK